MSKLNLRNTSVLFTGGLTALLQYMVTVDNMKLSSWPVVMNAVLTLLVAAHGAITNSVFSSSKTGQEIDHLVSEGEVIVTDVQTAVQSANGDK